MDRVPGFEPGGYRFESCSVQRLLPMLSKFSIFSHTQKSFSDQVHACLGKGRRQAAQLYASWFRKGAFPDLEGWPEKQAIPLVEQILALTDTALPEMTAEKRDGDTVKFLLKYPDGLESESVLIPMEAGYTLCVSSQIGCRMGCAFCETGKMGLIRNLTAAEIVSQLFYARFKLGAFVRNIVFMGMGEPLDNYEEVMRAVQVLTDPSGLQLGPSRITLSTSGQVDAIYRLIEEADPALNLAVSVNASNDQTRRRVMPVNRKWDMAVLKEAMLAYCAHPRREIFIEYVLLKDINDSLVCAEELATYLEGLRVKVNLIPYNPQSRDRFAPPEEPQIEAFMAHMRQRGYQTLIRHPRGQKIMGACGQLGNLYRTLCV